MRGPVTRFLFEFISFGIKQAWACLFGGAMVAPAVFSGIVGVTGSYAIAFATVGAFLLPAAWLLLRSPKTV